MCFPIFSAYEIFLDATVYIFGGISHGKMPKMKTIISISMLFLFLGLCVPTPKAQTITIGVPEKIDPAQKYLFYLHGAIVSQMGAENAVSKYYGHYEYQKILDTFASHRFHVISEVRPKNTKEEKYASKLKRQIKTLIKAKVSPENITVVGASLGAYIAIETAYKLKNKRVKFALLGLCSKYAVGYYGKYRGKLRGNFLSIYEASDQKNSCKEIFTPLNKKARFKEITLEMGNSHGFLYKPFDEWVLPLVEWANG